MEWPRPSPPGMDFTTQQMCYMHLNLTSEPTDQSSSFLPFWIAQSFSYEIGQALNDSAKSKPTRHGFKSHQMFDTHLKLTSEPTVQSSSLLPFWIAQSVSYKIGQAVNGSAQAEPTRHRFYNSANVWHSLEPNFLTDGPIFKFLSILDCSECQL